MTNPKTVADDQSVAGRSKPASPPEAAKASDETRCSSEERRFQDALEDDEVKEALRVLHKAEATRNVTKRP